MKLIAALVFSLFSAATFAQGLAGCEAKAVSENGKKLSGAAKNSFMKKCESEAR